MVASIYMPTDSTPPAPATKRLIQYCNHNKLPLIIGCDTTRQIKDPKHPLHCLLRPVKVSHSQMVLRPTYPYQIPLAKTSRRGRDFVPYCISISSCLGLLYILEYLIVVTLVRFVLLLLLFNFVMHCIMSTVVVAFEINYLYLSLMRDGEVRNVTREVTP